MKTKLYKIAVAFALLITATVSQAQVIVVQHGASASVYGNLDSAMTAASAGDYLYLSGGVFLVHGIRAHSGNDSINFYKPLHLVGAGMNPDSTQVTQATVIQGIITGSNTDISLIFGSAAGGSTFDGIDFNGNHISFGNGEDEPDSAGSFIFNRCRFLTVECSALGGEAGVNVNLQFHECIMTNLSDAGQNNCTAVFDRCIVTGQCQSLSAGVTWTNCVMGEPVDEGTITNCIIYGGANSFVNQFGAVFNNCLFAIAAPAPGGADVFNNCSFGVDIPGQFVNAPYQTFSWSYDYHLANGALAHNFGNDGHDDGIYGGSTPAKAGYVPYNPHYTGVTIPTSTDANGNLNINIHVSAQTY